MNEYERYGDYTQQRTDNAGSSGAGRAVVFLLIGIGIGAATAVLLTPVSGAECRENIRKGYRNALDGISQQTRSLRDRGSNLLGFVRRKVANG